MLDMLLDALIDSAKILPFVFLIYILMEVIENVRGREKIEKALSSKYSPIIASVTGIVPECGFSVMCAKLFDKGLITIGTLLAAFISTSDEGLIILISSAVSAKDILLLVGVKIVFAIAVGTLFNVLLKKFDIKHSCSEHGECLECGEETKGFWNTFVLHPLVHTVKVFIYLLVVNVIFGLILYLIGDGNFYYFVEQNKYLQPLVAPIIGIIPNCSSSIILSQAYVKGFIGFAGLVAGLSANAGMGLIIIFRNKKNWKSGIVILAALLFSSIILGYIALLF